MAQKVRRHGKPLQFDRLVRRHIEEGQLRLDDVGRDGEERAGELGEQRLRLRVALSQDIAPGERCDLSLREGWQPQLIQRQAAAPAAASPLVPTP